MLGYIWLLGIRDSQKNHMWFPISYRTPMQNIETQKSYIILFIFGRNWEIFMQIKQGHMWHIMHLLVQQIYP